MTSFISETNISAFRRTWCSLERLIGMALKHHLMNGVYSVTLLTGNFTDHERNKKQRGKKNEACRPAIWRSHMKRIRSVMPAKKKTSVFMEKMFDLTRGSVWKSKGRMAGLVKSKKIVIMLTKKNLNKNLLNNLARDNLLQNIKPGKTYSIKIKKKRRRRRKKILSNIILEKIPIWVIVENTIFFALKSALLFSQFCSLSCWRSVCGKRWGTV